MIKQKQRIYKQQNEREKRGINEDQVNAVFHNLPVTQMQRGAADEGIYLTPSNIDGIDDHVTNHHHKMLPSCVEHN